jgi:hypothetical protein
MTMWPAAAKAGSISLAAVASRPEKIMRGPRPGVHASTRIPSTSPGGGDERRHFIASA